YDVTISPVPTTSAVYTLSLHDALPISWTLCPAPVSFANAALLTKRALQSLWLPQGTGPSLVAGPLPRKAASKQALPGGDRDACRSEEHTSELQSRENLVCRLLLEKKKK